VNEGRKKEDGKPAKAEEHGSAPTGRFLHSAFRRVISDSAALDFESAISSQRYRKRFRLHERISVCRSKENRRAGCRARRAVRKWSIR
jgi:hypothetical protein